MFDQYQLIDYQYQIQKDYKGTNFDHHEVSHVLVILF